MTAEKIKNCPGTKWAGQNLIYLEETDSTNTRAKELGAAGAPHGTLVVAEKQNAGKGRRGRSWESPAGSSIYMTILLRPDFAPSQAPMLTLVMAHSIAGAIREQTQAEVGIKWPNDLVVNGKKICGILTEMNAGVGRIDYVVIGVGINVNTEGFPEEIADKATSLYLELGKKQDRAKLIAAGMQRFEEDYEKFCAAGDLSPFVEEYNKILVNCGKEVRVLEPGNEYNARSFGIDASGELQVEKADGTREAVFAGEVSVRGIYGYT